MNARKHQLLTGGQVIINLLKQQGVKRRLQKLLACLERTYSP